MHFKASLSKTSILLTLLVLLLVGWVPASVFFYGAGNVPFLFKLGIILLLALSLLIGWGYSVRGYGVERGELLIKRPFQNKVVDLRDIRYAQRADLKDMRKSFRVFGSGGYFGHFGKFYNKKYGSMAWYATDLKNAVLLTLHNGKKLLVTPDAPEEFIQVLGIRQ